MPAHDAIRGEILRLADRDLDRYDFAREATRVLRRAVPFDASPASGSTRRPGCRSTSGSTTPSTGGAGSRLAEIELDEADIDSVQASSPPRADRPPA